MADRGRSVVVGVMAVGALLLTAVLLMAQSRGAGAAGALPGQVCDTARTVAGAPCPRISGVPGPIGSLTIPTATTSPPTTVPPIANPVTLTPSGLVGTPGAGIDLSGSGYPPSCRTAYFYFDKTRIGSGPINSSRQATVTEVAVPGDSRTGVHQVSTSCHASGRPALQVRTYLIKPSAIHRPAFLTSLVEPRQVSLTLRSIALSSAIAAALFLLLGFPAQLFNATLAEHYEQVRGWFHLRRPLSEVAQGVNQRFLAPAFLLAGGALYAFLTPDVGFNRTTAALVIGLALAVAVTTVGFAIPSYLYFGFRLHDRGKLMVLPGTLLVGALCVVVSRLMHFQPGYLYGVLAVFVFHHDPDRKHRGELAAVSAVFVLALAALAWAARVPVSGYNMRSGASFWSLILEAALAGAFVIGLESTIVGLLPMRFLDGSKIKAWSRTVWTILFVLALAALIQILIQPGTGYVGHTSLVGKVLVVVLYVGFCLFSLGFWAYFRYRPGESSREDLEAEGEYGIR